MPLLCPAFGVADEGVAQVAAVGFIPPIDMKAVASVGNGEVVPGPW